MTHYPYENLDGAAEALRVAAIKARCAEAAIPTGEDADLSWKQKEDAAAIADEFSGVWAMIYPFMNLPAPGDFDVLIKYLTAAAQVLITTQNTPDPALRLEKGQNDTFSGVTTVGDNLASWSGAAAREFKANYLDKLPMQTAGQFNVAAHCIKLVQQEQLVWQEARNNVVELVNKAIDVMEDLSRRCSKNKWTVTLTVVASVASIAAVPLAAAGAGVAVALTTVVIDKAASAAGAFPPEDPPKRLEFQATTAHGVLSELDRGLRELVLRIDEQERKIAQVLDGTNDVIESYRSAFVPKQPVLAGATRENITSHNYLGFSS